MLALAGLLDEIESDLSVFHRVEEVGSMDSGRFCRLVPMLPAYRGAVAAALARADREAAQAPAVAPVQAAAPPAPAVIPRPASTATEIGMSAHSDLFSFGGAGV